MGGGDNTGGRGINRGSRVFVAVAAVVFFASLVLLKKRNHQQQLSDALLARKLR